jgi:radical SAM superfamily enzyme YgiQ (UPF0313 family)
MEYDFPLFRPPSEANSLILQATYGCSWNKCAFCEMYTSKKFFIRKTEDMIRDIESLSMYRDQVKKVFLADANAMVLKYSDMCDILLSLKKHFPKLRRISSYALPSDILRKTDSELRSLNTLGLDLLYIGIESGSDKVLKKMNKCEDYQSTSRALIKARKNGIRLSVMILNGLGGKKLMEEHARMSARILNEIQPEYLSTLVLSFPISYRHFIRRLNSDFEMLNKEGLLEELALFLNDLELDTTVYRSDHASNYLELKGVLNKDKARLLDAIGFALRHPEVLRDEAYRAL